MRIILFAFSLKLNIYNITLKVTPLESIQLLYMTINEIGHISRYLNENDNGTINANRRL